MPFETNVKCTDTQWELTKSYDPLKVHEKYIDIYIYILYRGHLKTNGRKCRKQTH